MRRRISYLLMRLGGWRYIGEAPRDKKFVVIAVPHTSMWDFVWGKFAFSSKGVNPVIFIKRESFFFPLGILLRWLGARPVNRGRGAVGLVDQVIHYFNTSDTFQVCITPEGTRDLESKWKKGFYFIAQKTGVPIYLGIIDYKNKILTIGDKLIPSGNVEEDMALIREYYKRHNPQAKYPEKFTFDFS
ncbi:MAG: 1-acyl-sn-glycerol-3-phosphate acyltransferase [Salinivirgaceae bacterium]